MADDGEEDDVGGSARRIVERTLRRYMGVATAMFLVLVVIIVAPSRSAQRAAFSTDFDIAPTLTPVTVPGPVRTTTVPTTTSLAPISTSPTTTSFTIPTSTTTSTASTSTTSTSTSTTSTTLLPCAGLPVRCP